MSIRVGLETYTSDWRCWMCFLNPTVPQHLCFVAGNVMAVSSIFHKPGKATAFFRSSANLLSHIVHLQRKHAGITDPFFKDLEVISRQGWRNLEFWTKSSISPILLRPYSSIASPAQVSEAIREGGIDLTQYPPERIRNFSIIAHVDHGKSTMADRLLELTGTIKKGHGQPQYLDKLQVERERGITVKAQTVTMFYNYAKHSSKLDTSAAIDTVRSTEECKYLLNLIDTPGHVDFSYEVSRSLAACQGVLLLVDASQGVQAQTVANFYLAFEADLAIIPVINKIDQPNANPENVKNQLKNMFDIDPQDVLLASAKTGMGLSAVLPAVIDRIRYPNGGALSPLRMLLLDSYYDEYKGVICHVAIVDGALKKGEKIASAATGQSYEVMDVGILHPELTPTNLLLTGQVGYIVTGMRSTQEARIGDTLHHIRTVVEPLPGTFT